MSRAVFEGFSAVMPDGWTEMLEDATYSDPDQPAAMAFAAPGGTGTMYVSAFSLHEALESLPPAAEHAEALAVDWGRRRGLPPPLLVGCEAEGHAARATAVFRVADDFVQVWAIIHGTELIEATYTSRWEVHERDRAAREALVASLRLD